VSWWIDRLVFLTAIVWAFDWLKRRFDLGWVDSTGLMLCFIALGRLANLAIDTLVAVRDRK
jgi:hypothetical protein